MKKIGDKIIKVSIYILVVGIAWAILSMIGELASVIISSDMIKEATDSVGVFVVQGTGFIAIWSILVNFALRIFISYIVHLLTAGYGRMVKDNQLKAECANELNSILKKHFDEESESCTLPWE